MSIRLFCYYLNHSKAFVSFYFIGSIVKYISTLKVIDRIAKIIDKHASKWNADYVRLC